MVATTTLAAPGHVAHHTPRLHGPWFAGNGEGVTLHRYFDDQFVPRFLQDAIAHRLSATRSQDWFTSDRFGRTDVTTLRLPLHQTFYIASCEVSCEFFAAAGRSLPAFDPRRILSSGFVVRRRTAGGDIQRWMVRDGVALGWQGGAIGAQDPDEYRRLRKLALLPAQFPEPGYSGEEFHPMHALQVPGRPAEAGGRPHTLLWGYLPLGGSFRASGPVAPGAQARQALAQELGWPFGLRDTRDWQTQDNRPAFHGLAGGALYALLDSLVLRHRVYDASDPANSALRSTLASIHFYPALIEQLDVAFDPYAVPPAQTSADSLLEWIENSRDALFIWLSRISSGQASVATLALPRQTDTNTAAEPVFVARDDDLYLSADQARTLREQLVERGAQAMATAEQGLAMPRYGQGADDRYFIVPFLRWRDDCGCEEITWGAQHSIDFRVASPFDPQAARPRAIILPGLADLKRGSAQGVTLMAPKSLADLLRKIKPDMDVGSGGPGNPAGLCWSFSLSIPVITIVAFVLIMIVINLLNLIFFWLPWAILAIPRWCGMTPGEEH
jgi:hypothetical protein